MPKDTSRAPEVVGEIERRAAMADVGAAVAHELASALGAILGWVEVARQQSSRVPEALDIIETCATSARATARYLLDAVRPMGSDAGSGEITDLSALLREVSHLAQPSAYGKRVLVQSDIEPGLWARAGRAQLFTIGWNLVQNAVQAAPPGGHIWVTGKGEPQSIRVEVSDDGPGIAPEVAARIFEPYFTTRKEGTGLGLAIVRETTAALLGRVWYQDRTPAGACFVVALNRADAPEVPTVERVTGVRDRIYTDLHILIVEDNDALRELMVTAFGLRGARVTAASSASEAMMEDGPFDIALIDFVLDDMRGDVLLAELRKSGVVSRAMLVSGASLPPVIATGGEPDAWIRKPFELAELDEVVHRLVGSSTLRQNGEP